MQKHRKNAWINRDIIQTKRKIKRMRKKKKTFTPQFTALKLDLQSKVKQARNNFFSNTIAEFIKNDPRKFWRYLSQSKKEIKKVRVGDTILDDPTSIADTFNQYFQSVFSIHDEYNLPNVSPVSENEFDITSEGVLAMLLKLDNKKSTGPDGLSNSFLRRYAQQISIFLTALFNFSITSGDVPAGWRIARVAPVHKSGDRLLPKNYRPVSVTSSCCKLLEHVVVTFIQDFVNKNNILSPHQHGFRRGLSTTTQLISTVHKISSVLDQSGQIDVLFLDLSKAFDRVPHGKLLYKLECIGLPLYIIRWIASYLADRKQFVEIDHCPSSALSVTSGVPQGSVLGPLLFLLYVNDLMDVVPHDVSISMFADDCAVFKEISSTNDHLLLQKTLLAIDDWCMRWGMALNSEKTVLLRVTRKKCPSSFSYILHQEPVLEVSQYKYLGVTLTRKLTWSEHILDISSSALRKLWFLKRKLKNAPISTKMLAYNTCVRSKLEYAAEVWDPHFKKDVMQLERVQRKAIRFIFGKYRRHDSPSLLMQKYNVLTLETRRKVSRLGFLHNCLVGKTKLLLPNCIKPLTSRKTRHNHEYSLSPIFARTDTHKYTFFPRTVSEWNSLPREVFESADFMKELESHIVNFDV